MAHRPAGAVPIGWTHTTSCQAIADRPFRSILAAAAAPPPRLSSEPPRSRALPPAAGTAPHFLLARPSSGWLGIASQSPPAGADFQLGFSPPHFAATGLRLRAVGASLHPLRLVHCGWMRIGTRPGGWQGPGIWLPELPPPCGEICGHLGGHDFRPLCPGPV